MTISLDDQIRTRNPKNVKLQNI